ncbi:MerR family transcriptional regulator [Leucobacter chromiiresistens]|uniref:MerR HTH family regulatory protein n=1 Tax=Leucobacter chromiiresistens TaxID=1079994 RepID=A0A1H0ZM33_9MICO|nr:MerR family transcriptional regulator [Leucobacter chromiiresistens]SDQ28575.1 MerR HTH family regulatory protein [Leucobacter chromiiresistens]
MEHTQRPGGDAAIPSAQALSEAGIVADPAAFTPVSVDADVLFDDGLPRPNQDGGFKGATAARAAGITYRQLDYWARTGLVEPTVRGAKGSGSQRLYGFRDILVLKLVKRLLDTGISLQQIRTAVAQLHEAGVHDLSQTTLMSDGSSVYLCTSSDEVIDLVSRGQGVFGIAVGKVLREVETSLVDMDEHREEASADTAVDELAARRKSRKIS